MGRYGKLNYARLTKGGFLLGLSLFLIGAGGEWLVHSWITQAPSWEDTLFFDLEIIGLLIGFFSPILFGIVLPLTE